jgi:hypothetical protein
MKHERGMGTLMTVFSGVAALMCLLVGLQLLSLETRISQAAGQASGVQDTQFRQWEDEVHTGAVMSFGAGILILLFGLRHQTSRNKSGARRLFSQDTEDPAADLDSLSIRIFEVDAEDHTIEITAPDEESGEFEYHSEPRQWAPLADDEQGPAKIARNPGDPAESILKSISEATGAEVGCPKTPAPPEPPKSFWSNIFRPPKKN